MQVNAKEAISAINWNTPENGYAEMFWHQTIKQFWFPEEYYPSTDLPSWNSLTPAMKKTYIRALGGLTGLDTEQSSVGMPQMITAVEGAQNKAVLTGFCYMESIHARSYSNIFTSICTKEEINDVFNWVENCREIQKKASLIDANYKNMGKPDATAEDIFKGMYSSVFLESFLFYSGFFLPLWLSGNGQMKNSGDIIKKIMADEAQHGVFIGVLVQEQFEKIPDEDKDRVISEMYDLLDVLMENELVYTDYLYTEIGLSSDVKEYVKYNANKALMNMGFDVKYEHDEINPIVMNGLSGQTTQHDFFSMKSTNYEVAVDIKPLTDDDFKLDLNCEI